MYKIGSLFSGIGSFEQAFKNLKIDSSIELYCDIDKYAQKTFLSNFKANNIFYNIKDIKELPELDYLCVSSPCTDFSISGLRDLSLGRSTLVLKAIELILKNPPKYIIFENVKSILDKKNIDFFKKQIAYPLENKYNIQWYILNPINFGVPHFRERLFLIGQREDIKWKKLDYLSYSQSIDYGEVKFGNIEDNNAAEEYYLSNICLNRIRNIEQRAKLKGLGYKNTLIDKNGIFKNLDASYAKGPDGKRSFILDSLTNRARMATLLECKRLMSFPDDFIVPVSKTQAYKQFGNSINVRILEEVIKGLKS